MKNIQNGGIQLPEFQRDWVWNDEKIRFLIASVLSDYPIGALMFLACGKKDAIPFQYRIISGAPQISESPEELVLDGQQRLTAIYCAMYSDKPVKTKNGKSAQAEYLYYVNIEKALDKTNDMVEAIESIDIKTNSASLLMPENQYKKKMFPLNIILDEEKKDDWFDSYKDYHGKDSDTFKKAKQFKTSVAAKVTKYKIPVIMLEKDTPLESICRMFESINKSGLPLTVFDLLTATFARYGYNLNDDWKKIQDSKNFEKEDSILSLVKPVDFIVACTLFSSYVKSKSEGVRIGCKRNDILNLKIAEYKDCRDKVKEGFIKTKIFLAEEKIFRNKDLPYKTQLIPLAVLWALVKLNRIENAATKNKIRQWYWCGVFGEFYNNAANSGRYVSDVVDVMNWIYGGDVPKLVQEMDLDIKRLFSRKGSAIHQGILALILQNNPKDFIKGDNMGTAFFHNKNVEIHHIFPQKHCKTKKLNKDKWDCALNKTPLLNDTNNTLGGDAPSKYLKKINLDEKTLSEQLTDNWIDIEDLRNDNFENFILHRAMHVLKAIGKVCGKDFENIDEESLKKFLIIET